MDWWLGAMGRLVRAMCSHPLGGQLVRRFGKRALLCHHPHFFSFVFMDLIILVILMISFSQPGSTLKELGK